MLPSTLVRLWRMWCNRCACAMWCRGHGILLLMHMWVVLCSCRLAEEPGPGPGMVGHCMLLVAVVCKLQLRPRLAAITRTLSKIWLEYWSLAAEERLPFREDGRYRPNVSETKIGSQRMKTATQ